MTELNKFYDEFYAVYQSEYNKLVDAGNIPNEKVSQFLASVPYDTSFSHFDRLSDRFPDLKYTYNFPKANISSVCFKMMSPETGIESAYAYLYCDENTPIFFCYSSALKSQDGEYRSRVIPYEQFEKHYATFIDFLAPIEELIVDKIEAGLITLFALFYQSRVKPGVKLRKFIDKKRLPIKFYMICWLVDYFNIHLGLEENHINPHYKQLIYSPDDSDVLSTLMENPNFYHIRQGFIALVQLYEDITTGERDPEKFRVVLSVGQKIIPITVMEVLSFGDINFGVWHEMYINTITTNMVMNLICPSFPLSGEYFYVQNVDENLFDNPAMWEKFEHSKIACKISDQLREIDKYNYVSGDLNRGPRTKQFLSLSKKIHESIINADSNICLTSLAICTVSEYTGRTVRDIPKLVKSNMYPMYQNLFSTLYFKKHIFEFIYALYCLNTKFGIMHGDLHLNNVTMCVNVNTVFDEKSYAVYVVGGTAYYFSHNGVFSTLIDFSRAILGDVNMLTEDFGQAFASTHTIRQQGLLLKLIEQHFPQLYSAHKDNLTTIVVKKFPEMFKIATSIDTFVLLSNFKAMFTLDENFKDVKTEKTLLDFIDEITDYVETSVSDNLVALLKDPTRTLTRWPHLEIIERFYSDHLLDDAFVAKKPKIIEIFNSNNDIKYDVQDPGTWNMVMKTDKVNELLAKYHQTELLKEMKTYEQFWHKYYGVDYSAGIKKLVQKYAEKEKNYIPIEPWMLE